VSDNPAGWAGRGFYVVDAPGSYANSQLNGSECVVLTRSFRCVTVLLLTGESAGREWQLLPEHLRRAEVSA
jgi:hypothetical protein